MADGFVSPVALAAPNDGTGRLFILDQTGVVYVLDAEGNRLPEPLLDLRSKMVELNPDYDERGLLGVALHPEFVDNGRFYLYYSAPPRPGIPDRWDHTGILSEFTISADNPNRADPDSERIILQLDQPQPNHNGGQVAFGPDGFLYLAQGDGGNWADVGIGHPPEGNGQALNTLLGKIIRIDVDSGSPYTIPADNPFVGQEGVLPEIYAYGFRNPFRFSFDAGGNHDLFAGEVGQDFMEEIDKVVSGGNYGWPVREGTTCFNLASVSQPLESCASEGANGDPFLNPVIEYGRDVGRSTLGGYVYRGTALPELNGRYLFLDWVANEEIEGRKIYYADTNQPEDTLWEYVAIPLSMADGSEVPAFYSLSFGEDSQNELYLLTTDVYNPVGTSGKVYKIVPVE
ncbi:MAG: PQQ-dependent sugar dehydrogenase [Anaerolineae bacterium]|nr:PQQ-dependent sugar dehydrogenase [Anaerolineae bacterium]